MTVSNTKELMEHIGCPVEIAYYGDRDDPESVTIECLKCNQVLVEFGRDQDQQSQLNTAEAFIKMAEEIEQQAAEWKKKYNNNGYQTAIHVWFENSNEFYSFSDAYNALGAYFKAIVDHGYARLAMELDLELTGDPDEEETLFQYG